ncbi:MBL fold metallo-hydrolase [Microbacterium sp. MAHUQ-60]|uniref:MBL fold metallo-hydrolase n=1 Tax=unclassified Microbacterium TaxID=2609290 RepID=UPI003620F4BC
MAIVRQCRMCGVEYDAGDLPALCPICVDERQYLAEDRRQHWVDPMDFTGRISVIEPEPGLTEPPAAITDEAVTAVRALGPLRAVIASHPHMYGLQSMWAREFDAEVFLSSADRQWLGAQPDRVRFWDGRIELVPGVVASQPGGHFPGSVVVHWVGADGSGVLLSGDTVFVNPDGATLSFMRSFPNRIPLSAAVAERIARHLEQYAFDRIYDNFGHSIRRQARAAVRASAARHAGWARGDFDHLTGPG